MTAGGQWHAAKSNYLFPVRALSKYYRGTMVHLLRKAEQDGFLHRVTEPGEIDTLLDRLMETPWVVYSKPCLNRIETVVRYLARYSHRIALSDGRLVAIEGQQVRLRYKDYRDRGQNKVMTLSGAELIRRFLRHSLPKGLMRIRHYGFLANRCRVSKMARIREYLGRPSIADTEDPAIISDLNPLNVLMSLVCPKCHRGHLQAVALISPKPFYGG